MNNVRDSNAMPAEPDLPTLGPRPRSWRPVLLAAGWIAVAAMVAAVGYIATKAIEAAEQNSCRGTMHRQALGLYSYFSRNGTLPPAVVTDAQGNPTHSWRTLVADHIEYDSNLLATINLSKPWNDPINQNALVGFETLWHCQQHAASDLQVTDYVAIVGPGTAWPGPTQFDELSTRGGGPKQSLPRSSRILIVEWPDSEIEWSEPRDITVDDFLAWYRQQQRQPNLPHGDSIHYIGYDFKPHSLSLETTEEEVRRLLVGAPPEEGETPKP